MALLTVRAAAEQLGVAYSTLKRWVHTGRVRTTRTEGGHHRISDNEIGRLLARQEPEGPLRANDVHRLPQAVQDEHRLIERRFHTRIRQ